MNGPWSLCGRLRETGHDNVSCAKCHEALEQIRKILSHHRGVELDEAAFRTRVARKTMWCICAEPSPSPTKFHDKWDVCTSCGGAVKETVRETNQQVLVSVPNKREDQTITMGRPRKDAAGAATTTIEDTKGPIPAPSWDDDDSDENPFGEEEEKFTEEDVQKAAKTTTPVTNGKSAVVDSSVSTGLLQTLVDGQNTSLSATAKIALGVESLANTLETLGTQVDKISVFLGALDERFNTLSEGLDEKLKRIYQQVKGISNGTATVTSSSSAKPPTVSKIEPVVASPAPAKETQVDDGLRPFVAGDVQLIKNWTSNFLAGEEYDLTDVATSMTSALQKKKGIRASVDQIKTTLIDLKDILKVDGNTLSRL